MAFARILVIDKAKRRPQVCPAGVWGCGFARFCKMPFRRSGFDPACGGRIDHHIWREELLAKFPTGAPYDRSSRPRGTASLAGIVWTSVGGLLTQRTLSLP